MPEKTSKSNSGKNTKPNNTRREFLSGAVGFVIAGGLAVGTDHFITDPRDRASNQAQLEQARFDAYKSGVGDTIKKIGINTYGPNGDILGTNLNQQRDHFEPLRLYGQVFDDICLLLKKCIDIRQRCDTDVNVRNGVRYLVANLPRAVTQANEVELLLTGKDPGISVWDALDESITEADALGAIAVEDETGLQAAVQGDVNSIAAWNSDHTDDSGIYEGSGTLFYTYKDYAEALLKKNPDNAIPILKEQSGATMGYKSVLLGGKLYLIRDLDFGMQRFLESYSGKAEEWDDLTWAPVTEAVRSIIRYDPTDQYLAGWCEQKGYYVHGGLKEFKDNLGDFDLPIPNPESIHPKFRKPFRDFYNSLSTQAQNAFVKLLSGQVPEDAIMELQNATAKNDVISKTQGYETSIQKRIDRFIELNRLDSWDQLMLALRDRTQSQQYGDLFDQFHPWFVPETSPIIPKNYANLDPEETVKETIRNAKVELGFDKRYNNAMGIDGACAAEDMTYYLGAGQKRGYIGWVNMVSGAVKPLGIPLYVIRTAEGNSVRGGLVLNDSNGNISLVFDWDNDDGWSAKDYMSTIVKGQHAFTHGPFMNSSRMYQFLNFS